MCFRPLTGIMVLIFSIGKSLKNYEMYLVSVPLRGLWFLSKVVTAFKAKGGTTFPSPYGDYGSYLFALKCYNTVAKTGFRPLTGIMVLIDFEEVSGIRVPLEVSVPLRGLWFLSSVRE